MGTLEKFGYRFCPNTTRRYLKKNEYYAFKPRRKPYLTKQHKENQLRFTKLYSYLKDEDVTYICFTDESTFEIGLDSSPP